MSLIREYLSMENHSEAPAAAPEVNVEVEVEVEVPEVQDVSDEEKYEAEETLAEAAVAKAKTEEVHREAVGIEQELSDHIASVEHHMDILSHGIENGQFSPQYAASVTYALERYAGLLGDEVVTVPSLEAYGHENLQGHYEASMEAFGDIGKALKDTLSGVKAKIARRIRAIGGDEKVSAAVTKQADAGLNDLAGIKTDGKVSVSTKGVVGRFNREGKFAEGLPSTTAKDIKDALDMAKDYVKESREFADDMAEVLKKAAANKSEDGTDKIIEGLGGKKLPAHGVIDKGLLGAKVSFDGDAEINKSNTSESLDLVSKKGSIPELDETKTQGEPKEIELSKADVTTLHQRAKQYAEASNQITKLEEEVSGITEAYEKKISELGVGPIHDDLKPISTIVANTLYGTTWLLSNIAIDCRTKAIALNQLGERAAAQLKKADKDTKKDDE